MPIDVVAIFVALPVVGLVVFGVFFLCEAWATDAGTGLETRGAPDSIQALFTGSTLLLAVLFIAVSLPKLTELAVAVHEFGRWGYSESFMRVVGAVEFAGAIALLIPRIRLIAVTVLSLIMTGAIYTHLAFDPAYAILLPTAALGLLICVGYVSLRQE